MKKTTKRLAAGAALAGAVGYLTGILTAPKSGKETRQDISEAAVKAKTEAEKNLKKLHSELGELIEQGKDKVGKLTDKAKTEMNSVLAGAGTAKDKARELLSSLHEGDFDHKDLTKAVKEVNNAVEHLKAFLQKNAKTSR